MTNMTRLYLTYQVAKISEVETAFDHDIQSAQSKVKKWADSEGPTNVNEKMRKLASKSISDPAEGSNPSPQFLADHF